jgi:hypothetical protein
MGGTRSDYAVQSTWRRGETLGATACHPYTGDDERLPRGGRGLSAVVENPSLILVINDTKLLMPYVKCFELDISNTYDEGVCGKE